MILDKKISKIIISLTMLSALSTSTYASDMFHFEAGASLGVDARRDSSLHTIYIDKNTKPSNASFEDYSARTSMGLYIRPWIGKTFRFAPFVKFDYSALIYANQQGDNIIGTTSSTQTTITTSKKPKLDYSSKFIKTDYGVVAGTIDYINLMYGGLVGVHIDSIWTTFFIGASYSQFLQSTMHNTWAANYGFKIDLPKYGSTKSYSTIGLEGSFQTPYVSQLDAKAPLHRVQITFGIAI
ncbi:hypothetical protein BKH43_04660 [Helicobacter sp. 13S00401-1]|uniref:hypothetical protein n=1 Tax=Helicobacter sp. 13S00401-1 TaxID=1905758 RepID=UPI000BA5C77D|nr:hypothetical protein [Helicobacter sp. 13S00401-1]PAF50386.1 hypothetical protein BKH43_04660 [Helicobacter sp. 13S00401-1]